MSREHSLAFATSASISHRFSARTFRTFRSRKYIPLQHRTSFRSRYPRFVPRCSYSDVNASSSFSAEVTFNPSNEVTYLSGRSLGDDGISSLSQAFESCGACATRLLSLESNRISDAGAVSLSRAIANNSLPRLEELLLLNNNISDAGVEALCKALITANSSTLRVLSLARNRLGERSGRALAELVAQCTSLTHLYLMGKQVPGIGDVGAECFVEALRENGNKNGSFWFLNIDGNKCSREVLRKIRNACTHPRACIFPYDPYPGYKPTGTWKTDAV